MGKSISGLKKTTKPILCAYTVVMCTSLVHWFSYWFMFRAPLEELTTLSQTHYSAGKEDTPSTYAPPDAFSLPGLSYFPRSWGANWNTA